MRPRLSERLSPSADVRSEFWLCIRWWCDPHYAVSPGPHPQALSIRVRAVAQERVISAEDRSCFFARSFAVRVFDCGLNIVRDCLYISDNYLLWCCGF